MKGLTLVTVVTNILFKKVSEEEAKDFALNNFGELCAAIRAEHVRYLLSQRKQKPLRIDDTRNGRRTRFLGGNALDKRPSRTKTDS